MQPYSLLFTLIKKRAKVIFNFNNSSIILFKELIIFYFNLDTNFNENFNKNNLQFIFEYIF